MTLNFDLESYIFGIFSITKCLKLENYWSDFDAIFHDKVS